MEMKMEMEQRVHQVVFVPVPGMGHLIPMVELAKHILRVSPYQHRLTITFLIIPTLTPKPHLSSFLSSTSLSHPSLSFVHLPLLSSPLPPLPPSTRIELFAHSYLSLYVSSISSTLRSLHSASSPVSALVLDFFYSNAIDIALELGIPPYVFFTSSAIMLAVMLHSPSLDPLLPNDRKAVEISGHVIPFPSFSSGLPFSSLPDVYAHGKDETYELFVSLGLYIQKATGILANTFAELEPGVIQALEEGLYVKGHPTPSLYPVGPLLALGVGEERGEKHECIRWLDEQPCGSVVFLCFGSLGSFPEAQVKEIAVGLERSGRAFLWVMRDAGLPEGFVERTRERGLVWMEFAPQKEILQHEAVGGFVTHCGWNSCLESLWFGVPMATWPLYAEQHLNAFEMVEEMKVALEVKVDRLAGNTATAEEVERAVEVLMGEGSKGVREKVKRMKEEARRALQGGTGSSCYALEKVVEVWTNVKSQNNQKNLRSF